MKLLKKGDLKELLAFGDLMNSINGGRVKVQTRMHQKESQYVLEVNAAGLEQDAFHININGNYLTVSAYYHQPLVTADGAHEIEGPMFSKTIEIPPYVDAQEIEAYFGHKGLIIIMPLSNQTEQYRRVVEIKPL